jgi:hypothetical protein
MYAGAKNPNTGQTHLEVILFCLFLLKFNYKLQTILYV